MTKQKLPRTLLAFEALLEDTRKAAYASGYADARRILVAEHQQILERQQKTWEREISADRRNAIQGLTRLAESMATVGRALSIAVEPRQM